MLAETAKEWTEQWFAEGLQEGLQQGLEQGRRDIVVRQARLRFGDAVADRLSPVLERITGPAALAEVGDWVIQCGDGGGAGRSRAGRCGLRQRPVRSLTSSARPTHRRPRCLVHQMLWMSPRIS